MVVREPWFALVPAFAAPRKSASGPLQSRASTAACLQPAKADVACPIPSASGAVHREADWCREDRLSWVKWEHQSTARYRRSVERAEADVVGPRQSPNLEECPEGLRVAVRGSKSDQEGAGAVVAVCRGSVACPLAAVRDWLAAADARLRTRGSKVGSGAPFPPRFIEGGLTRRHPAFLARR